MLESICAFAVVLALVLLLSLALNSCGGFEFVNHPFNADDNDFGNGGGNR